MFTWAALKMTTESGFRLRIQAKTNVLRYALVFSFLHALITLCLTLYVYKRGMVRFDNPEIPVTMVESVAKLTVQVLIQPVHFLWTESIRRYLNSFEWVFFCLNSFLWGWGSSGFLFALRGGQRQITGGNTGFR